MFLVVPVTLVAMTKRSKAEVGERVKDRRLELGLTEGQVIQAAKIDTKTYGSLEDGSRWPQERTRLRIEPVLRWQPGSIDRLLNGEEPIEIPAEYPVSRQHDDGNDMPVHVPEFLPAARLTWKFVTELAESPDGDPERSMKADRAVIATADTITDALLRLNTGPEAKGLIYEMGHRSHELIEKHYQPPTEGAEDGIPTTQATPPGASPEARQAEEAKSVAEKLQDRGGRPLADIEGSKDPRVDRRPEGDRGENLSGGEVI